MPLTPPHHPPPIHIPPLDQCNLLPSLRCYPPLGPPNAQSVATQFDFVASWLVAVAIHHSPEHTPPPPPAHTPGWHGLCGNSVHRLAAIKCTCRIVFAVTFIRRYSAFFLNPRPPSPTLYLVSHRAYAEWAIKSLPCNLAMAIVFYLCCARQHQPPLPPSLTVPPLPLLRSVCVAFFDNLFDGFKLPTLLRLQKCISRCLSLSGQQEMATKRGGGPGEWARERTML